MKERIKRETTHEEFIQTLISGDQAVFREIWRVLLFAASYGVKKGQRTPLGTVDKGKAFPESYFDTPGWKGFLYLLGFCDGEDSDHLRNDKEQHKKLITAFEEYANYGLYEMTKIVTSSTDPLGDLVTFIIDNTQEELEAPDLNLSGDDDQL